MTDETLRHYALRGIDAQIAELQAQRALLLQRPEAKPHWTATPEGRARMAEIQRKRWAKKKKAPTAK